MTFQEIEKTVKNDGWYLAKIHGSHYHYLHKIKKGKVTIPRHGGDLHPKVISSILKQAGLK